MGLDTIRFIDLHWLIIFLLLFILIKEKYYWTLDAILHSKYLVQQAKCTFSDIQGNSKNVILFLFIISFYSSLTFPASIPRPTTHVKLLREKQYFGANAVNSDATLHVNQRCNFIAATKNEKK